MKEKIFINARIIDPSQKMDEKGSLILDKNGKVKVIGKNVKKTDAESSAEIFDIKVAIFSVVPTGEVDSIITKSSSLISSPFK